MDSCHICQAEPVVIFLRPHRVAYCEEHEELGVAERRQRRVRPGTQSTVPSLEELPAEATHEASVVTGNAIRTQGAEDSAAPGHEVPQKSEEDEIGDEIQAALEPAPEQPAAEAAIDKPDPRLRLKCTHANCVIVATSPAGFAHYVENGEVVNSELIEAGPEPALTTAECSDCGRKYRYKEKPARWVRELLLAAEEKAKEREMEAALRS